MSKSEHYNTLGVTEVFTFPSGTNINLTQSPHPNALIFEENTKILYVGSKDGWTSIGGGDESQFLLLDGSRPMTGPLNMDTNNIINSGTINNVTIEAHAPRHLPNGADPLTTAAPLISLSTSTTNSTGTANSLARSDHSHAIDLTSLDLNSIGGILGVPKGGTGATSFTSNFALQGNGTSPVTATKVLPTGTIVGTSDVQVLTNKTLLISGGNNVEANNVITIHGNLSGLLADDHPQYLLVNGSRAMTGTLNMGSNSINFASNVNGVVIEAHAARHLPNGFDPLTTAAPITTLTTSTINSTGTANSLARSDHTHAIDQTTFSLNSLGGILGVPKGGTGTTTFTSGFALQGNGTSAITATKLLPTGDIVGTTDIQLLTNKNITGSTNNVDANALKTTGASVNVSSASPPTTDQLLIATSATTATWQSSINVSSVTSTSVNTATLNNPGGVLSIGSTTTTLNFNNTPVINFNSPGSNYSALTPISPTDNNGIVIDNTLSTLKLEFADGTHNGIISTTTQSYGGNKTFNNDVNVLGNIDMVNSTLSTGLLTKGGTRFLHNFGTGNTFGGVSSGNLTMTGIDNVGFGTQTLVSNTTGSFCTAIGFQTLFSNLSGNNNTGIGQASLGGNTTGSNNTATGVLSLASNTTGTPNSAFGFASLQKNTTGGNLTAMGFSSLFNNLTGIGNSAFGLNSLFSNTTGSNNLATGIDSLRSHTTGSNNVGIGPTALNNLLTGSNNIALGTGAGGQLNAAESGNIMIGNIGVIGDTNTIKIGTSQTTNFQAGIYGVATGGSPFPVVAINTDQLGTLPLTMPSGPDTLVARNTVDTLTNKTIIGSTNNVDANALKTTGASVNVSSAAPPTTNQLLIATSPTTATWQSSINVTSVNTSTLNNPGGTLSIGSITTTIDFNNTPVINLNSPGTSYTSAAPIVATDNNGIVIDNVLSTLKLEFADGTHNGIVSTTTQSYGGDKTFNDNVNLLGNLDMVNTIAAGADGVFTKGGTRFLHNYNSSNIFLGLNAGNFTTIESNNIGIGSNALTAIQSASFIVAIGDESMASLTTGSNCTAVGSNSMAANNTGTLNSAFGDFSLNDNISGRENCAFGSSSLLFNTTGGFNTALGAFSMQNNVGGLNNTAVGRGALINCISGNNNVSVGIDSGTSGSSCVMIGASAGSDGNNNVAIGFESQLNNSANDTTSIGYQALRRNTSGLRNTGLGFQVLEQNQTGSDNNGFGYNCLTLNTVSGNCAFGSSSLSTNTSGSNNSIFGSAAAVNLTSGSSNIIIGNSAGSALTSTESGNILIDSVGVVSDNNVVRIGTSQTTNFQAGIFGIATGGSPFPVVAINTNQLGTLPLTMPSGPDTLVARNTVDTLTNKSFVDNSTFIVDNSDNTKRIGFDAAGTTGTTTTLLSSQTTDKILTLPNATDTLVGKNTADIFTNKTITSSTNNVDANALKTSGTSVNVSSASPPTTNQLLIATSATTATWQSSISIVNETLSGNINFTPATSTSTTGNITKGGNPFLHNFGTSSTFLGLTAGNLTNTGSFNIGIGDGSLINLTTGSDNTCIGLQTGFLIQTGSANAACGELALNANVSGNNNAALGRSALLLCTGSTNSALGSGAGSALTTGSDNICINNAGVAGESSTIRIGAVQTKAFFAGIRGITTTAADAIAVLISSTGQLGTISSERSTKDNIVDVEDVSDIIKKLRPRRFTMKEDESKKLTYGLIVDECEELIPDLIVNFKENIRTIQYQHLPIILLKQIQTQQTQIEELYQEINKLKNMFVK